MIKKSKENVAKNISAYLSTVRWQGYGISQPDIAKETGISQRQLSCFEQGKAIPSLLNAIALADMFDISLDYLVGRCSNSKAHKTQRETKFKEDK